MPLPFSGPATPLRPSDITTAAARIGCTEAAVKAVTTVETGGLGGFLADGTGRPKILFEAHVFSALTGHRYDASHPTISAAAADWRLYRGGAAEYARLAEAEALAAEMALQSASWGLFQIMGESHRVCGYVDALAMATACVTGEAAQLDMFVRFVLADQRLVASLRNHDWAMFARVYNGPDYAANRYDVKLQAAYAAALGPPAVAAAPPLRIGSTGAAVSRLQAALNAEDHAGLATDGGFGQVTELAVRRFQDAHGLAADGMAGPATLAALGLSA